MTQCTRRCAEPQQNPRRQTGEDEAEQADRHPEPLCRTREERQSARDGHDAASEEDPPVQTGNARIALETREERHPGQQRTNDERGATRRRGGGREPVAAADRCLRSGPRHVFGRTPKNRYAFDGMSSVMPVPCACSARTVARLFPATI